MRWILDDGPLEDLARTVAPDATDPWQPGVLLVAGTTAAAASPTRQVLLDVRVDGKPIIATFEIQIGSGDPAEQVLIDLHADAGSTTNLAECEGIAWAQVHAPDAVFVCADKRAALTALAELGRGRVAHPFDAWLDLRHRGWLTLETFERLCQWTRKGDQGLPRMPERIRRESLRVG